MEVQLKTLTPLHIGNGEELFALDYVKDNSCFYRVSQKHFLNFLSNDKELLQKYNEWIIETSNKNDNLKEQRKSETRKENKQDYNQQLSRLQKEFNLLTFVESNTKKKKEFIDYLINTDQVLKIKYSAEPKSQIRGFIKTPLNIPYIPGTSFKGAIRTALLFKFLTSKDNTEKIAAIIRKEIDNYSAEKKKSKDNPKYKFKPETLKKKFADSIEQFAFYCETIDGKGHSKKDDEKFDIMKFLSVSDGSLYKNDLILANIDLYLVSKKKDQRTGKIDIVADKQSQAPCVEAIPQNTLIKADIDFDIQFLLNIKEKFENNAIKQGKDLIWIDLKKKVKDVFNLDIDTLTNKNQEEKKKEVLNFVFDAIAEFSKIQLKEEKKWIKEYSEKDTRKTYSNKIDAGFNNLFAQKGTLLHVGYATGFIGITEFLYLKNENYLKEVFKEVMELFNIGDRPGAKHTEFKPYTANPDKFPKSRRLTESGGKIHPLGWLLLINLSNEQDPTKELVEDEKSIQNDQPIEIIAEFRNVKIKTGAILEGIVLDGGMVEVYMPDKSKKIVKLVRGKADLGRVVEVTIYPDGKGNFNQASLGKYKK